MTFVKEQNDIINTVIRPFVVEQPYEVPGDFYMSSNDEFKVGDRIFFIDNHSMGIFGNVEKVDYDDCLYCTKLLVRTDDNQIYKICGSYVVNLSK